MLSVRLLLLTVFEAHRITNDWGLLMTVLKLTGY